MDVQTIIINACSDVVQLYHSIPADRPAEFGTVERTGGDLINYVVDRALVTVRIYAPDRARLRDITGTMRDALERLVMTETNVFGSEILSVYESNDLQARELSSTINAQIIYNY